MDDKIKFYTDEHIAAAVVAALTRRGIEVLRSQDVGAIGAEDSLHLEFAAQAGYVVVTQDTDFLRLHASGVQHAGIVYAPQHTSVAYFVRMLTLLADVMTPDEMLEHVEYL